MLPGSSNVLCRLPIDALMLCIYLACRLRKRLIFLFRLATIGYWLAIIEDCTLPEVSLGVSSAKFEPNSYLDPWRLGLETHPLWATSRLPDLHRTSWRAKGPGLEFILGCKATTPGPLEPTNLSHRGRAEEEASQSSILRENIFGTLFTCVSSLL